MAIAYGGRLTDSGGTTASSETRSLTITGSNTALMVAVQHTSARTVSSVTYAGTNLTKILGDIVGEGAIRVDIWYLVGTATGTNNIVTTMSGSDTFRTSALWYTGVGSGASTGGTDCSTSVSWSATTANQTATVTTVADNVWLCGYWRSQSTYVAGTNVTLREDISGVLDTEDTNGPLTPAGSYSQTINYSSGGAGAGAWGIIGMKPFSTTAVNSGFLNFM